MQKLKNFLLIMAEDNLQRKPGLFPATNIVVATMIGA